MNAEEPILVVNIADIHTVSSVTGTRFGRVFFERREKLPGWFGTEATSSAVKIVPSGGREPLFSATHSVEEVGFIVSGNGEYHAGSTSFPIRQGDFLLAPEGVSKKFEVENTGSAELVFVAFQARRHYANLTRRDRARAVIDAYIQKRWAQGTRNDEGYEFDGHILTVFDREFTMLITYDQFGSIWINGRRLAEKTGESIEECANKIVELERELKRERVPEKA